MVQIITGTESRYMRGVLETCFELARDCHEHPLMISIIECQRMLKHLPEKTIEEVLE